MTQATVNDSLDATLTTGSIVERYREPEYLALKRRDALETYRQQASPSRVEHLWRYTDPAPFAPNGDQTQITSEQPVSPAAELLQAEHLAGYAVWHGGRMVDRHLDADLADRGVVLADLHEAARTHQPLIEQHLASTIGVEFGKYEALNLALWQAGFLVYVPRGTVVDRPVHVVFSGDAGVPFFVPRLLVVVEEGSQLTLTSELVSPRGEVIGTNTVLESIVGPGAHLRQVTVQRWGDRVTSHLTQRASVDRDGQFLSVFAGLGAGLSKADLGARLDGRGAQVKLLGMSFGQNEQHFDHHTVHDHRAGQTFSDLDFKVVLKDKARSVYTGLIRIEDHAANCEAYQENRNLLLSEGTRADTIPELEILTDEVRCSHGATIGPLDEQEIFYLTARGIPRDEAIRMVVGGFMEPTLREVPEDLRERLRGYVIERVREI